jgi:hypothetical protein
VRVSEWPRIASAGDQTEGIRRADAILAAAVESNIHGVSEDLSVGA